MRTCTSLRIAASNVRMVPVITTLSGMMLPRTPPWMVAIVTTAGAAVTSIWRDVIDCSALTIWVATTTGSTPRHGYAPCVCLPCTVMLSPSAAAIAPPALYETAPASSGQTWMPNTAFTFGFSITP